MPSFRLAMIQMLVEGGARDANLERARARVLEAGRMGADVVVLPEALDLGWTHPSAAELAGEIPDGPAFRALARAALDAGVHLCAGLVERAGTEVFNSAVLIDPRGRLLLLHRKLNELEIGRAFYGRGDRLGVVPTPWGRFGVMICADAFAPGEPISRALGHMGAVAILSPCAWAVEAGHDDAREPYGALWRGVYGSPARDFGLWIAGVSNVGPMTAGPWAGRRCIGNSMLVGPSGEPVVVGPHGERAEAILACEVETRPGRA